MIEIPQKPFTDRKRVLHVLNLPYDASKDEVCNFFTGYEVEHIELIKMKTGNPSGNALAQFSTKDQAENALQENDEKQIRGKTIRIKLADKDNIRDYREGEFYAREREFDDESKRIQFTRKRERDRERYDHYSSEHRDELNEWFQRISAQIDNSQKSTSDSIGKLEKKMDGRFQKLEDRFQEMGRIFDENFAQISNTRPTFQKMNKD